MGDSGDDHTTSGVVDRVDDAVVAHTDAEVVATGELDRPSGARVDGKGIDGRADPLLDGPLQLPVLARRDREEPDVVGRGYSRTSDQGMASSPSTRARSASRLSSK
jgi:hypothetical protein